MLSPHYLNDPSNWISPDLYYPVFRPVMRTLTSFAIQTVVGYLGVPSSPQEAP
jgi:hypothetical protein